MPNQAHLNSTGRIDTMSVRPRAFLSMWCPEGSTVMAQCKYCGNKGFFLSVSEHGLCNACHTPVVVDINQRMSRVNESMRIIQNSKVLGTQLHRFELIQEDLNVLCEYEEKGIAHGASKLLDTLDAFREDVIANNIKAAVDSAIAKADAAPSAKQSMTAASKALLTINEGLQELPGNNELIACKHRVNKYVSDAKLNSVLDSAKLAEFKGKTNRAIDLYKEALFHLNNIDDKDQWQLEQVAEIETRIKELSQ